VKCTLIDLISQEPIESYISVDNSLESAKQSALKNILGHPRFKKTDSNTGFHAGKLIKYLILKSNKIENIQQKFDLIFLLINPLNI